MKCYRGLLLPPLPLLPLLLLLLLLLRHPDLQCFFLLCHRLLLLAQRAYL